LQGKSPFFAIFWDYSLFVSFKIIANKTLKILYMFDNQYDILLSKKIV